MEQRGANRAGTFGRGARLALGLCLAVITLPVYFDADITYVSASLALTLGLVGVYIAVHVLVSRYFAGINRWVIAVLAVLPVALVWSLGQGGGPLFGQGEGGTAALTYLTISFLADFITGHAGCEVMAIPGLLFRTRTHLPCILLCCVDHAEDGLRRT